MIVSTCSRLFPPVPPLPGVRIYSLQWTFSWLSLSVSRPVSGPSCWFILKKNKEKQSFKKYELRFRAQASVLPVKADSSTQPDCRRLEDKLQLRATQRGAGNAVQPPLSLNGTREIHYDCAVVSLLCRRSAEGPNRQKLP